LQRHREIAAAFAILRGKAASEEDRHASRVAALLACSSTNDVDIRRSGREAGVVCPAADVQCKILRSGSAG
jgi:hypothetical protein